MFFDMTLKSQARSRRRDKGRGTGGGGLGLEPLPFLLEFSEVEKQLTCQKIYD